MRNRSLRYPSSMRHWLNNSTWSQEPVLETQKLVKKLQPSSKRKARNSCTEAGKKSDFISTTSALPSSWHDSGRLEDKKTTCSFSLGKQRGAWNTRPMFWLFRDLHKGLVSAPRDSEHWQGTSILWVAGGRWQEESLAFGCSSREPQTALCRSQHSCKWSGESTSLWLSPWEGKRRLKCTLNIPDL